ncbi:hypothetical protein GW17_00024280 [Ensete ventricosum]|nr:hypothetical protein GW17_00024280 [Ensete ventricosum]
MGGAYRSVRLPVRGPPATGRFCQKSTVGGRLREKLIVGGRLCEKSTVGVRLREKRGRRRSGKEEKKKREVPISPRHPRRRVVVARGSPAPARYWAIISSFVGYENPLGTIGTYTQQVGIEDANAVGNVSGTYTQHIEGANVGNVGASYPINMYNPQVQMSGCAVCDAYSEARPLVYNAINEYANGPSYPVTMPASRVGGYVQVYSSLNLQVKLEQGLEMLSILKTHKYKESILDAFAFYDKREAAIRRRTARQQETRTTTKNQISKRFVQVVKFKGETSNVWIPKEKTSSSNGADSSTTPKDVSKPGMVSEIKSS